MLDVTKYPPSAHGFTCRNCGGGDRGRVAIYRPFGEVSLSLNRTVTCMVLKANDRRTSCPCHDEFRGPRSDYVRQQLFQARLRHKHAYIRFINRTNETTASTTARPSAKRRFNRTRSKRKGFETKKALRERFASMNDTSRRRSS
ncbi:uncharacterized protein TNCV_3673511 [Trichonephila clavipes]|nr:uncharacterized protein TNCV_3673511 [Trichonephila clavipes]